MFSLPGMLVLTIFLVLHPQEYFTSLLQYPILNDSLLLALFGFAIDVRLGIIKLHATRHFWWVVLFVLWCLFTVLLRDRAALVPSIMALLVPTAIFLIIAHGIQTFRALHIVLGLLLAITVFLSIVGVHQKFAPLGCYPTESAKGRPSWDGRYCTNYHECEDSAEAEPGVDYTCAHIGLLGTYSIGERVRFLGKLEDPNELALTIGVGLPLALGFMARKKSFFRTLITLGALALGGLCAVYTESRGGQLVMLTVLGAYFIRREGWRGLLLGALLVLPVLLFGGRENAEDSSEERLECAVAGFDMIRAYPIFGVGLGHFTDHHFLTAHNSYILAPAELGLPGMFIWTYILYLSIKIPIVALQRYVPGGPHDGRAGAAADWAMALMSGWLGLLLGIFFLSFCYKELLWIYVGFSGALYGVIRRHDPDFDVDFRSSEMAAVAGFDVALLAVWNFYARWKTGNL